MLHPGPSPLHRFGALAVTLLLAATAPAFADSKPAEDEAGNTGESEIKIGVNVDWDWSPSPSPSASPTPLPGSPGP